MICAGYRRPGTTPHGEAFRHSADNKRKSNSLVPAVDRMVMYNHWFNLYGSQEPLIGQRTVVEVECEMRVRGCYVAVISRWLVGIFGRESGTENDRHVSYSPMKMGEGQGHLQRHLVFPHWIMRRQPPKEPSPVGIGCAVRRCRRLTTAQAVILIPMSTKSL